jgi:hypothetical protein
MFNFIVNYIPINCGGDGDDKDNRHEGGEDLDNIDAFGS